MKPGYKTTEFWLTFAAMIIGALLASGLLAESSSALKAAAFIGTALASLGYTVTRGSVKTKTDPKPSE